MRISIIYATYDSNVKKTSSSFVYIRRRRKKSQYNAWLHTTYKTVYLV